MTLTRPLSQSLIYQKVVDTLNGVLANSSIMVNTALIQLRIPIALAPVTVSGPTAVGSTLTGLIPMYVNNPNVVYQWFRGTSPISGATSVSYVTASADTGLAISLQITATNPAGTLTIASNAITVTAH